MNFADAANWICQNPIDDVVITAIATAGVALACQAYREHQEAYRPSRELAAKWENMGRDRTKWPKLPPHSYDK